MGRRYQRKPDAKKKLALEHVKGLFDLAEEIFSTDAKMANRYVKIARTIAMKFKIRIPSGLQKRFCKHCYSYLVPSKNCRVRIHTSRLIYRCDSCKKFMRFPLK